MPALLVTIVAGLAMQRSHSAASSSASVVVMPMLLQMPPNSSHSGSLADEERLALAWG